MSNPKRKVTDLRLSLKTKWFEMTKAGIKTEDYRDINEYWIMRIFRNVDQDSVEEIINDLRQGKSIDWVGLWHLHFTKEFETTTLTLGYPSANDTDRIIQFEHAGIEIRTGNPEWGAEPNKLYFVIKHGKRIL